MLGLRVAPAVSWILPVAVAAAPPNGLLNVSRQHDDNVAGGGGGSRDDWRRGELRHVGRDDQCVFLGGVVADSPRQPPDLPGLGGARSLAPIRSAPSVRARGCFARVPERACWRMASTNGAPVVVAAEWTDLR